MSRSIVFALLLVLTGLFAPSLSRAHELQPGYAALEQIDQSNWKVFWRTPDVSGKPMAIDLLLPSICQPQSGPATVPKSGAWETGWIATCGGSLLGQKLIISGLEATKTDVLVRFAPLDQSAVSLRLTAYQPSLILPREPGQWEVFSTYAGLGFEHILEGWDHLLFLFALLILIKGFWRLVGAVTAFTVAHSLTLVASTMNWITLPAAPVEAVIALSIVFLASEIVLTKPGTKRLSQSAPWLVTFAFGLLHGLGFAGALREIGLPQSDIPLALFAFNVGVEAGQLAFVLAAGFLFWLLSLPFGRQSVLGYRAITVALAYAIGGWSSYWLIERIVSFS
ncbi:HupE / UreJ protein [Roseibium album]|nr:HupE / UreJ protein [Roseibium album]